MPDSTIANEKRFLGDLGSRIAVFAGLVAAAGLLMSLLIALVMDEGGREQFFHSYLVAVCLAFSLSLGSLFFVLIQHATRAGWSVTVRRIMELLASNLVWLWVLLIPILFFGGMDVLYHWTHIEPNPGGTFDEKLYAAKDAYLNRPFFIIRSLIYAVVWIGITWFYFRTSLQQDRTGDPALTSRMQWWAPVCLLAYALTQSFFAFDYLMARDWHWFSTMFAVYFFAGSCCGAFSLMIIVSYLLQRSGRLTRTITLEHYQDMGKMLFAFGVVFWAYIAYSQFMLIWYANIPEETAWYFPRQVTPWLSVSVLLLIGHFIGPFVLIISKHPKRMPGVIALVACWMLLMQFIDLFWLARPEVPEALHHADDYAVLAESVEQAYASGEAAPGSEYFTGYSWHLMDVLMTAGVLALYIAITAVRARRVSLVPEADPRLGEALAFENV